MPPILELGRLIAEMPSKASILLQFWDEYRWIEYEVTGSIVSVDIEQSVRDIPLYTTGYPEISYLRGGQSNKIRLEIIPDTMVAKPFNSGSNPEPAKKQIKQPDIKQLSLFKDEEQ